MMKILSNYNRSNTPPPSTAYLASNKNKRRLLSLKLGLASVVWASTSLSAQQPEAKPTVVAGSKVNLASVTEAVWLQGEGPKSFEPGKIYIFECWATWCGPCIGMIPHVNELHKKYYDRGLRVYGLSVWEDGKEKVEQFVKEKGAGMSYPVAYTGTGSSFEKEWLKSAGVKSIPHAFIVRNGKLLVSTQASRLTDTLIENLLSGEEGAKKVADRILFAQSNEGRIDEILTESFKARGKNDVTQMATLLEELKTLDPGHPEVPILELWGLIISKQWKAGIKALNSLPTGESKDNFIGFTGRLAADSNRYGFSEEFMKIYVNYYSEYISSCTSAIGPNHYVNLARIYWDLGDKENAVISADKSIEAAKVFAKGEAFRVKAYSRFAKSVNEGVLPKYSDISLWYREAAKEAKEAKEGSE